MTPMRDRWWSLAFSVGMVVFYILMLLLPTAHMWITCVNVVGLVLWAFNVVVEADTIRLHRAREKRERDDDAR